MFNNKEPEERIDDAVSYIKQVDKQLGLAVEKAMTSDRTRVVSKDISLGLFAKRIDKDRRGALRALLLCQRYYISNLYTRTNMLDSNWHTISVDHWKSRNKNAIDNGIRVFTAPCDNAAELAEVAENAGGPPTSNNHRDYKLNRDERFTIGSGTCYMAVMAWLLKSGLVSYPWYLKSTAISSISDLKTKLGTPQQIWTSAQPFTSGSQLPPVPRGYIVYINYKEEFGYGHWLVSLGNGLAAGCNNDDTDGTPNLYSKNANLNNQFYHGFNEGNATGTPKGVAYVFDPAQIPNRKMV
ncbi:MAG: hypothetical protein AAGC65_11830 [Mucilaginibacter sp.]|uniref:hypothetical protein n=1 Tax=Mucilaginibacter sp. TaxID=1882438 RepID=UPI0031A1DB54